MARWVHGHPPLPQRLVFPCDLRLQVPWIWRGRVAHPEERPLKAAILLLMMTLLLPLASAVVPNVFEAERMSALRLSADTEPNELIYRVRGYDPDKDYGLTFDISGADSSLINITSDYEYGYVYLLQRLNERKNYSFILTVADKVGDKTEVVSRIIPTSGRTPLSDIFVKYSASAVVPENSGSGAEVTYVVVRKKARMSVDFVILGKSAKLFKITSRLYSSDTYRGDIVLQGQLDYEAACLHVLKVCAINPYTNEQFDTRNIACVTISILVEDRQDQPPVLNAQPVTRITGDTLRGDPLLVIDGEDGDRGVPRDILFSMQTSSTAYADFFFIDPETGTIFLEDSVNNLVDSMKTLEPILATVTAVEVGGSESRAPEEEYTSSIEIAFVITDADVMSPKFQYSQYVGSVDENALPETQVVFSNDFFKDNVKGTFRLVIVGGDGDTMFEIVPNVVRDSESFAIVVKNPELLDYETRTRVEFKLVAEQVSGTASSSSSTEIRIDINDLNDNYPVFLQDYYQAEVYENITAETKIARIQATDLDKGIFGDIRYTRLNGNMADKLALDQISGLITCATNSHGIDRESNPELPLTAEACDNNGFGNCAFTRILIIVRDVNDETPVFPELVFKGYMAPEMNRLKTPVKIVATDRDAEEPNNQVVYSLDPGIYSQNFRIDRFTGELFVSEPLSNNAVSGGFSEAVDRDFVENHRRSVINLQVRATDQGTPSLSRAVPVEIYTQDYVERRITFVYPEPKIAVDSDWRKVQDVLDEIIGGVTSILGVERYSSQDDTRSQLSRELSAVETRVYYEFKTVINVEEISQQLCTTSPLRTDETDPVEIELLQGQRNSYLAGVVVLCIFLALIILAVILCWMCPGCPFYSNRKKRLAVADENAERVSYIRVDEQGNYRQAYEEEKIWWDYLPTCCTDFATQCGMQRPKRNVGRLAWSGDERQRYWQINGGGEGVPLDDRALVPRGPRDMVLLEDLDEARMGGRIGRVDSRTSQRAQDDRRMFMVRDQRGNPRMAESLREGEHYLMEDMDDGPRTLDPRAMNMNDPRQMQMADPRALAMNDPRGMHMDDPRMMGMNDPRMRIDEQPRGPPMQNADDNSTYARPGNVEVLRLRASPRGAVLRDDGGTGRRNRQMRRAGGEPEETVYPEDMQHHRRTVLLHEDAGGGGISARHVEGQSVGVTPRSELEMMQEDGRGFVPTSMRYLRIESPPQSDVQIQTDNVGGNRQEVGFEHVVPRLRIRTPIEEETNSLLEAEGRSTRREKMKKQRNSNAQTIVEPQVHEDNTSRRSVKITQPPNQLYQHTKSSILRFETNKAKMDEDSKKESTSRRSSISGTDGRRSSSVDSRSIDGRRSISQAALDGRRSNSQAALDGRRSNSQVTLEVPRGANTERRASLPGMETTGLEREAARRGRRESLGPQDQQDASLQATDGRDYDDEDSGNEDTTSRKLRRQSNPRYMEWYDKEKGSKDKKSSKNPKIEVRESGEGSESQTRVISEGSSQDHLRVPNVDGTSNNVADDSKDNDEELKNLMENEVNLGMNEGSQLFENDAEMEAAINDGRRRRKRNHLLEKKSIFTIAYDDMQTDQLRPESAAAEP